MLTTDSDVAHIEECHGGVMELGPKTYHLFRNGDGRTRLWIGRRAECDLSVLPDVGVVYFSHESDNRW